MMKIIADSSANISALEGVCFQSIPMTIRAGEREFVDDGTLDTAKMLDYLASYNGKSGTACPGLDAWLQAFSGADAGYLDRALANPEKVFYEFFTFNP